MPQNKPLLATLDGKGLATATGLRAPAAPTDAFRLVDFQVGKEQIDAARLQLEQNLTLAINDGDTALRNAINLRLTEAQVRALIGAAVQGGIEYRGLAAGDADSPEKATGETEFELGWMYRISSGGSSAFGFPTSAGDFVLRNAAGEWDKIDNASASVVGQGIVEVEPVGENQFRVKLAQSFLDQIAADEAAIAALQTVTTQHEAALQQVESDQVAMQGEISDLQSDVSGLQTDVSTISGVVASHGVTLNEIQQKNYDQDQVLYALNVAVPRHEQALANLEATDTQFHHNFNAITNKNDQQDQLIANLQAADEAIELSVAEVVATTVAHGARLDTVESKIAQYWFKVQAGQVLEMSANATAAMVAYNAGVYTITHGKQAIITPEVFEISGTSAEHAIVRKGVAMLAMTTQSFVELPETDTFIVTV